MGILIDHHTHIKGNAESRNNDIVRILNISVEDNIPDTYFSIGLHPCDKKYLSDDYMQIVYQTAKQSNCVGIGETGLDYLHNEDRDTQKRFFEKHIELSEILKKPLIIHLVKATNDILEMKRKMSPKQVWMIHGFRGKPTVARIMIENNIYLSMGVFRNKESLSMAYQNGRLLLETDENTTTINEVYKSVSEDLSVSFDELVYNINRNTPFFVNRVCYCRLVNL